MENEKRKKLTRLFAKLAILMGILSGGAFVFYIFTVNTARKPAIYLYPEENSFISVKIRPRGAIGKTNPNYNKGWSVFATKEGVLNSQYDYLFYEVVLFDYHWPSNGWVVKYENLASWFGDYLPKFGLNEKEKEQFVVYWLDELPEANYYEIKLLSKEFLDENMRLDVSPPPDTEIRLIFGFKPLDQQISISEPLVETPKRKGFTLVEWGGVLRAK